MDEVCKKVFEKELITHDIIGKKWIIDSKKNWLFISNENREKLAKKLFKILYKQLSENNINIDKFITNFSENNTINK